MAMVSLNSLPVFSVVMPAYNSGRYIEQAILSVQSQSFVEWELLVVDDGSNDCTVKVVKNLQSRDSRIILLRNKFNKGASGARSTAISRASGQYYAFLDSDDVWGEDHLESLLVHFSNGYDLLHANISLVNDAGLPVGKYIFPSRVGLNMMIISNFLANSTVSFSRRRFGVPVVPDFQSRNDYALWLSLFTASNCISFNIGNTGCCYRVHRGGLSSASFFTNCMRYFQVSTFFYGNYLPFLAFPFYLALSLIKKTLPFLFNFISRSLPLF